MYKINLTQEITDDVEETIALTTALEQGNLQTISMLVDKILKKKFDLDEYILLTGFRFPEDLKKVKLLLESLTEGCCNINETAEKLFKYNCPLIVVVCIFKNPELTKLLLDKGCAVDGHLAITGETALHLAVEYFDIGNVKLLVEHGAEIDAKDHENRTPLSRFQMNSDDSDEKLEILKLLLDKGASLNTNFFSRHHDPWLHTDIGEKATVMNKLLFQADHRVLQLLMPYVDFSHKDAKKRTPLHLLVQNLNPNVLGVLKGKSYDINARDSNGLTPLDLAVYGENPERVRFLLERGANPNNVNKYGVALKRIMMEVPTSEQTKNILEISLIYNMDPQLVMHNPNGSIRLESTMEKDLDCVKLLLAQLAKLESCGVLLDKAVFEKIKSNQTLEEYFDFCKEQIAKMKVTAVCGSITLYKLLCDSLKSLTKYTRNEDFLANYQLIKSNNYNLCSYYVNSLKIRVDRAIVIAKMEDEAVSAVYQITALPVPISSRIINYMNLSDLENLSAI